jgi:UDP-N-acetylmuramyl pentapeptide phosphotransferase/UDP-N-acetylglucosamine-1-phosphate transferase
MPPLADLRDAPMLATIGVVAALAAWSMIPPLMPLLRRYALARPNARSSHSVPTPQGGGVAVVAAVTLVVLLVLALAPNVPAAEGLSLAVLLAAGLVLAGLGVLDDIRPMPALPRLAVQVAAVAAIAWTVPDGTRAMPDSVPLFVERLLVIVAGVWFVNLVNFMDGLDWMTFAGLAPASVAVALLAWAGAAPVAGGLVAAALAGGLLGFAPFNRPVARLFLGDVGSLPIGLFLGYALYRLAGNGHLLPALILPAYYLADATITLLRRMARGERFMEAHRSHFYQKATVNGLTVTGVVARVALVNIALAGTGAILAVAFTPARAALGCALAALVVAALLADFSTRRAGAGQRTA